MSHRFVYLKASKMRRKFVRPSEGEASNNELETAMQSRRSAEQRTVKATTRADIQLIVPEERPKTHYAAKLPREFGRLRPRVSETTTGVKIDRIGCRTIAKNYGGCVDQCLEEMRQHGRVALRAVRSLSRASGNSPPNTRNCTGDFPRSSPEQRRG